MTNQRPGSSPVPLPAATRLGAVRLQVGDLGRSLAYYSEIIGLREFDRTRDTATLGIAGGTEPLVVIHQIAGTRPAPRRGAYGLFHFAILLPDRADLGRFLSHLAAHRVPIGTADHLVSEALYLADPDGLGIEVYADRPRSTWPRLDGQIAMTTDPLDRNDLIEAGGRTPWTGVPPGTTMGHLHLHVGDLDRAAAFYHLTLGFDVTLRTYPGVLFYSAGGYHHHLGTNIWSPGPAATRDHARLMQWSLVLPEPAELTRIAARLAAAGYQATREDQHLITADPWGTSLRLESHTQLPLPDASTAI